MALSKWQVKELRLSEPQVYALLYIGSAQTRQEKHQMIRVCGRESKGYSDNYWSGVVEFRSREPKNVDSNGYRKKKTIRVKTFKTMEKKGYLTLSDTNPDNSYDLRAQLTDMGWDIFDVLANVAHKVVKAYDRRLEALIAEEKEKPKVWDINLTMRRKRIIPEYQHAEESFDGIEARTQAEAIAIAKERFRDQLLDPEGYTSWHEDNYWRRQEKAVEFWGDGASDEGIERDTDIAEAYFDESATEASEDEQFKLRAKKKVKAEMVPPWRFKAIPAYVEEGKRAPYLLDKVLKETGGIRLDQALAEDDPEPDTPDTDAADSGDDNGPDFGADMNRFAMMDLE